MPPTLHDIPQTITIDVLAERLGVSPFTLRTWLRQGRVNYYKLGKRVLIRVDDAKQFLEKNLHADGMPGASRPVRARKTRTA